MPVQPPLSPPAPTSVGGAAGAAPADTLATSPSAPSEQQLNAPTPLTLRLLGVMFLATFIPWVAAKAACNLREGIVRSPVDLPTDVFAKQPKSAALELQQRAATAHYREAAELAKGAAKDALLAEDARCQAEPAPCEALRARRDDVFTRAVLVSRSPTSAEVRVETSISGASERFMLRLEPEAGRWYVTTREPFSGALGDPAPPPPASTVSTAPSVPHGHP